MIARIEPLVRAAVVGAAGLTLIGCAADGNAQSPMASAQPSGTWVAPEPASDPAMVFPTPALRVELGRQGLPAGFTPQDWEYGRNDAFIGTIEPATVRAGGWYVVEDWEVQSQTSHRPRSYGRREVRTLRHGPYHP